VADEPIRQQSGQRIRAAKTFALRILALLAAAGALLCVQVSAVVMFTQKTWSDVWHTDFSIANLGAFGDTMAPWSAAFAMAAAFFAARAYDKQAVALASEQSKAHRLRFDAMFAQTIDLYDKAFANMERAASRADPQRTGQQLLKELQKFQKDELPAAADRTAFWTKKLSETRVQPVHRFARSVFAIIVWLEEAARGTGTADLSAWMRLFTDRMSGPERRILTVLLADWADDGARAAARRLRVLQCDQLVAQQSEDDDE
jgi:hypothetical protein